MLFKLRLDERRTEVIFACEAKRLHFEKGLKNILLISFCNAASTSLSQVQCVHKTETTDHTPLEDTVSPCIDYAATLLLYWLVLKIHVSQTEAETKRAKRCRHNDLLHRHFYVVFLTAVHCDHRGSPSRLWGNWLMKQRNWQKRWTNFETLVCTFSVGVIKLEFVFARLFVVPDCNPMIIGIAYNLKR